MNEKFCRDCAHMLEAGPFSWSQYAICLHPDGERDPVYGTFTTPCGVQRLFNGICGPEAKLFEQKPPEPVPEPAPMPPRECFVLSDPPEKRRGLIARIFVKG